MKTETLRKLMVALVAVLIMVTVGVALFIKQQQEKHKCYSYVNHVAGKFVVMVGGRQVAFVESQSEANKVMDSYKECQSHE